MPYRSIFLTKKGEELAKFCKNRHEIVYKFLLNIGVAPEVAHSDAEGLEHHVSVESSSKGADADTHQHRVLYGPRLCHGTAVKHFTLNPIPDT